MRKYIGSALILLAISLSCTRETGIQPLIKVKFSEEVFGKSISGRLIFLFDSDTSSSVVMGVNPANPQPVFTFDLVNHNPEDTLVIKTFQDEWYLKYSELKGEYVCRVILDADTLSRSSLVTKGNACSGRLKTGIIESRTDDLIFTVSNTFDGWVFTPSETITEERLRSKYLSEFWSSEIFIESALILPEDYYNSDIEYKLVFIMPGFGSSHAAVTYGTGQIDRYGINTVGENKIFVFMNGEFFQGYHHFVDSENNGPWGRALVEEFIPYIEKTYRVKAGASNRYLMGQSSGAWTSIWLQTNYPDKFNGAFAASPDPLDFRAMAFDIYKPGANFYFPSNPDSIQLTTAKNTKLFTMLEDVLGEFGQIRSWESSFSPALEKGTPAPLFERETGHVNPKIAEYWKKHDISNIIAEDPDYYRDKLSGKLHIYVSEDDPYGLAKSVHLIEDVLSNFDINAEIKFFNGMGHNVWTDSLRERIHKCIDRNNIE
ncbi:MAG: alpha/beta hydrolase-fold protein [Marinilabiliaceae bacterium]|jgi:pimeloyl-ACP methyl ester carboxylesterase|nr:alpha/beta hydrolase-fold protein [Marinilabiliaceae bacterium]